MALLDEFSFMWLCILCPELHDYEYGKSPMFEVHCIGLRLGLWRWEISSFFLSVTCLVLGCDNIILNLHFDSMLLCYFSFWFSCNNFLPHIFKRIKMKNIVKIWGQKVIILGPK